MEKNPSNILEQRQYVMVFQDGPRAGETMIYPTVPFRHGGYKLVGESIIGRIHKGFYSWEKIDEDFKR